MVFGMRGQVQPSSQPPPAAGENNDLSDSEKEDEEVVQEANCYTNGSFFLESKNKLTQWLSQTDMVEEVEKVIFVFKMLWRCQWPFAKMLLALPSLNSRSRNLCCLLSLDPLFPHILPPAGPRSCSPILMIILLMLMMMTMMMMMMMIDNCYEKKRAGLMWNDQHDRGTEEKRNRPPACRERRESQVGLVFVNDNVKHQEGFDSIMIHLYACMYNMHL